MIHYCEDCKGTGRDEAKTRALYQKDRYATGYIRCWTCNGGGLDPSAYFRWGPHPPLPSK